MEHCSRCGERPRRSVGQRWCLECHAAYARANRKRYTELSVEERRRANTRSYTRLLVKRGKIAKASECSECGSATRIEAHHPDYGNPWRVVWLCRSCHLKVSSGTAARSPESESKDPPSVHRPHSAPG